MAFLFGSPNGKTLTMPSGCGFDENGKPAKAGPGTWKGVLTALAKRIVNTPSSTEDCWLMAPSKKESYPPLRVGNKGGPGGQRNWRVHRVLYMLRKRADLRSKKTDDNCCHKCGNGWHDTLSQDQDLVCVNPWCITLGTMDDNRSDQRCKNGALCLCPHAKKCRFNSRITGKPKPCLNRPNDVPVCKCTPRCF